MPRDADPSGPTSRRRPCGVGVSVAALTDKDVILPARQARADAGKALEAPPARRDVLVGVSGSAITGQDSLDAFTEATLISLPVAIVPTSVLVFSPLFFDFRSFGRAGHPRGRKRRRPVGSGPSE